MFRPTVLAAAIAAAALFTPIAQAGEANSIAVQRADLNLQSEAGAETMLNRLNHAARRACGVSSTARLDLETFNNNRACMADAVQRAVDSLDAPLVTALHAERDLFTGGGIAQGDALQ